MMGHGWLIGFCVCILWVFCRFVFLGFPRGGIHRWLLFVVWFLVLAVVLLDHLSNAVEKEKLTGEKKRYQKKFVYTKNKCGMNIITAKQYQQ
jgi:hypothetical protein